MVAAGLRSGGAPPPLGGITIQIGSKSMWRCNDVFTRGGCEGHLAKFDSCVAEALSSVGLDWPDSDTGHSEYEGHSRIFLLRSSESYDMKGDGRRIVIIPAGNYIIRTRNSGQVELWTYPSECEARREFDAYDARYLDWPGN